MLKLQEESLDWSLKNIEKYGDTDIFPIPFEFKAIRANWESQLKGYLRNEDLFKWNIRPFRRSLTPKHRFGFRISTQLDPLDSIIFNALIYEIGNDIESSRIDKEKGIVFSNRFLPNNDGQMFDPNYNWMAFQDKSSELSDCGKYSHVIVADIADFYPRLYAHPLENALDMCTTKKNHVKKITSMIHDWNYSISYGIPVGPNGPGLLAELVIDDIDRSLIAEGIKHCRFVDDYRMFCSCEKQAYENLSYFANILFENHGLTLQQHKTKIMDVNTFKRTYLKSEDSKELDSLSDNFYKILEEIGINDVYETIDYNKLNPETQKEIDKLNLNEILLEQIESDNEIDSKLVAFILNRMGQLNNPNSIDLIFNNIDKLYTVFKNIFIYLNNLTCLSASYKSKLGEKLIELIDTSIVGHLEYHRAWVFDIFANDPEWNNKNEYINLYNKYYDDFSRRKLILALGKSNTYHWFKSQKRNLQSFSPWLKRAFLAGASCLPGDEAKHWYKSIDRFLDPLDKCVVEWAKKNIM